MKIKNSFLIMLFIALLSFSCSENDSDNDPQAEGEGLLIIPELSFDLDIDIDDFSRQQDNTPKGRSSQTRRTTGSNLDEFVVQILSFPSEDIIVSFENYSEAIAQGSVPLPAGNYILRTFNDDFPSVSPEFDFPYFFGESPVFAVEFEETTEADDLIITANNSKVTVNFSENIVEQFDEYELAVTTSENNQTLIFNETETRSGFFSSSFDLGLVGTFSFTRTDGTIDTRTIEHIIPNIVIATEYIINIDVVLQDGELIFNLILDDSFSEEIIDLGNGDIVEDEPFVPNGVPVITSPLNTFEENTTTTYNLTWEAVENATHYTVSVGPNTFNLPEFASNITDTSILINLEEGRNFFEVEAHFTDGSTTNYLGGNFRKLQNINTIDFFDEISPLDGDVINQSDSEVNDQEVTFQGLEILNIRDDSVRLHRNGNTSGQSTNVNGGFLFQEFNVNDGGMSFYRYSGILEGSTARRFDNYTHFIVVTDPDSTDFITLIQESNPLVVKIDLVEYSWDIGTPYFFLERRIAGTTNWVNINNGWYTSREVYDYDVEVGMTYEYRYRVNSSPNFVGDSSLSEIATITIN